MMKTIEQKTQRGHFLLFAFFILSFLAVPTPSRSEDQSSLDFCISFIESFKAGEKFEIPNYLVKLPENGRQHYTGDVLYEGRKDGVDIFVVVNNGVLGYYSLRVVGKKIALELLPTFRKVHDPVESDDSAYFLKAPIPKSVFEELESLNKARGNSFIAGLVGDELKEKSDRHKELDDYISRIDNTDNQVRGFSANNYDEKRMFVTSDGNESSFKTRNKLVEYSSFNWIDPKTGAIVGPKVKSGTHIYGHVSNYWRGFEPSSETE